MRLDAGQRALDQHGVLGELTGLHGHVQDREVVGHGRDHVAQDGGFLVPEIIAVQRDGEADRGIEAVGVDRQRGAEQGGRCDVLLGLAERPASVAPSLPRTTTRVWSATTWRLVTNKSGATRTALASGSNDEIA